MSGRFAYFVQRREYGPRGMLMATPILSKWPTKALADAEVERLGKFDYWVDVGFTTDPACSGPEWEEP